MTSKMHLAPQMMLSFLPPKYFECWYHISLFTKCILSPRSCSLWQPDLIPRCTWHTNTLCLGSDDSFTTERVSVFLHTLPCLEAATNTHSPTKTHVFVPTPFDKTVIRTEGKMARHPEGGGDQHVAFSGLWWESHQGAHPSVTWHLLEPHIGRTEHRPVVPN